MLSVVITLITLSLTSSTQECGNEGYTVTNYKNRGYLKLHKKGSQGDDCFKCWKSRDTYVVPYEDEELTEYSRTCRHDPKFYQVTELFPLFTFTLTFIYLLLLSVMSI